MAYLLSLTSALLLSRDAATDADFLRRRTVGLWFQIKETFNITQCADPVKSSKVQIDQRLLRRFAG